MSNRRETSGTSTAHARPLCTDFLPRLLLPSKAKGPPLLAETINRAAEEGKHRLGTTLRGQWGHGARQNRFQQIFTQFSRRLDREMLGRANSQRLLETSLCPLLLQLGLSLEADFR